jgi:hypothetical protein
MLQDTSRTNKDDDHCSIDDETFDEHECADFDPQINELIDQSVFRNKKKSEKIGARDAIEENS